MTEPKQSELETLKAQLAQTRTNLLHWQGVARDGTKNEELITGNLRESEAQVRELREAANKAFEEVNKTAQEYYLVGMSGGPKALALDQQRIGAKRVLDAIQAALRSAPPSEPKVVIGVDVAFGSDATVLSCPNCHTILQAPLYKTNAGEERKDLAKVPAGTQIAETRSESSAGDATVASARDARLLSEAVNRGPQDSPSRSHYTKHTLRCSYWENNVCDCRTPAPPSPARDSTSDNNMQTDVKPESI